MRYAGHAAVGHACTLRLDDLYLHGSPPRGVLNDSLRLSTAFDPFELCVTNQMTFISLCTRSEDRAASRRPMRRYESNGEEEERDRPGACDRKADEACKCDKIERGKDQHGDRCGNDQPCRAGMRGRVFEDRHRPSRNEQPGLDDRVEELLHQVRKATRRRHREWNAPSKVRQHLGEEEGWWWWWVGGCGWEGGGRGAGDRDGRRKVVRRKVRLV